MYTIGSSERADLPLAVVVGAGAMGAVIARRLAQSSRVLLADIDGRRAEEEAAALRTAGCDATGIACDVTAPQSVAALAQRVSELGGLGALAYVTGLAPSNADFSSIIGVNIMGAAFVADALLPLARQGSAAVFISSLGAHLSPVSPEVSAVLRNPAVADLAERLAAVVGPEGATPPLAYAVSKWGLMQMCRRQAYAWGERGARIVSVSPGMIATPFGALEFEKSPMKRTMYEKTPLKREGTMIEIADAVEFLVSSRASFISGTDLLVDGGLAGTLTRE